MSKTLDNYDILAIRALKSRKYDRLKKIRRLRTYCDWEGVGDWKDVVMWVLDILEKIRPVDVHRLLVDLDPNDLWKSQRPEVDNYWHGALYGLALQIRFIKVDNIPNFRRPARFRNPSPIRKDQVVHNKDCQLGNDWEECPACVEQFNSTCSPQERRAMPQ